MLRTGSIMYLVKKKFQRKNEQIKEYCTNIRNIYQNISRTMDVKWTPESSDSIVTVLGVPMLSFVGFKGKSFVWGELAVLQG